MHLRIVFLAVTLLLAGAGWAAADELTPPAADYRAELHIQAGSFVLSGPVYYARDKERRDLKLQGTSFPAKAMIIRRDKNVMWVLNTEHKAYSGVPLSSVQTIGSDFLSTALIEKTKLGPETVDGIKTTKYRVKFAGTSNGRLAGQIWLTPDNIVLRFEGEFSNKGQSALIHMGLANLKIGPQPAEVFEAPKGFKLVPATDPIMGIMAEPLPAIPGGRERDRHPFLPRRGTGAGAHAVD